jgi:leader peptidase (prepilin peptidase)/N-methyltransferase
MLARWSALISQRVAAARTFEEITILIAGASTVVASVVLVPNVHGAFGAGLAILMIAIAIIDARRFIIPDELTAAALALGFVDAVIQESDMIVQALFNGALRGAVVALAFFVLRVLYSRLRGREGIGLGDVKLAGVAGIWLDWWTIPIAIEIAALAALAAYATRLLYRGGPVRSMAKLPFGLFLAPAIWLAWLLNARFLVPLVPWVQ